MVAILRSYFPDAYYTTEVRLLALALTLINLVPAGFGLMWFFTIIPLLGLWIFWQQFKIVKGKTVSNDLEIVSLVSIIYNSLLLGFIIMMGGNDIYLYPMITYLAGVIGLNVLLIRVQKEAVNPK